MELLSKTDLPVTEIAYQFGFSDSNYFSRHFHNKINSTPKDFRIKNRKQKWVQGI